MWVFFFLSEAILFKILGLWGGHALSLSTRLPYTWRVPGGPFEQPLPVRLQDKNGSFTMHQLRGRHPFRTAMSIDYLQKLCKYLKCTLLFSPPLFSVWQIATAPNDRKQQNEKYVSICIVQEIEHYAVFTWWLAPGGVIRIWHTSYWRYLSFSARGFWEKVCCFSFKIAF